MPGIEIMKNINELFSMKNKVVFITGGAGYLGAAMCESLAEFGANIVIGSRNADNCTLLANKLRDSYGIKTEGLEVDILKVESLRSALSYINDKYNCLDVLINNAWSGKKNSLESISFDDWEYDIDMCLNAVFKTVKESLNLLKESKGVIVNIASMYGHLAPDYRLYDGNQFANPPSYGAAKAGVIQLTKYLASFLAPYGIRANSISPGPFPFPATRENVEFVERLKSKTILNRLGEPEDLKGVIALLCSDASSYITGQNICVDGGWGAW